MVDLPPPIQFDVGYAIREHQAVLAGTSTRPTNYRVLTPYLNEALIRVLDVVLPYELAFVLGYASFELAMISLFLIGMYHFQRIWFSPEYSLVGTVFTALSLTTTMSISYTFHPWSFTEGAILVFALLAIYHDKFRFVIFLSLLAVLNRKSGLVVLLAYYLANIDIRSTLYGDFSPVRNQWQELVAVGLVSGIPFLFLMTFRATPLTMEYLIYDVWLQTLRLWKSVVISTVAFLGLTWGLAAVGLPRLPDFLRRTSLVLVFYVPAVLALGDLTELRLLIPLYPFLIPAIVHVLSTNQLSPITYPQRAVDALTVVVGFTGAVFIVSAVLVTPEWVAMSVARDGTLSAENATIVANLRVIGSVTGTLMTVGAIGRFLVTT